MFVSPLWSFLFYSYVSKLSMTLGGLALISAFWRSQIWGELHIYCPFCVCLPQSSPNTMMWQWYESRRITGMMRVQRTAREHLPPSVASPSCPSTHSPVFRRCMCACGWVLIPTQHSYILDSWPPETNFTDLAKKLCCTCGAYAPLSTVE